jgi:hypothetical protein
LAFGHAAKCTGEGILVYLVFDRIAGSEGERERSRAGSLLAKEAGDEA